eukprot:gb/GFBE01083132.1/.p1 GENE.gb/GFBE01083132.1/~~gb/GFBE01083132.1/.p1  ORF type:complete len:340 (+),score=57.75 gb/GFBE01083132.1/:1-1020(+)
MCLNASFYIHMCDRFCTRMHGWACTRCCLLLVFLGPVTLATSEVLNMSCDNISDLGMALDIRECVNGTWDSAMSTSTSSSTSTYSTSTFTVSTLTSNTTTSATNTATTRSASSTSTYTRSATIVSTTTSTASMSTTSSSTYTRSTSTTSTLTTLTASTFTSTWSSTTTVDVSEWMRSIEGSVELYAPVAAAFASDPEAALAVHKTVVAISQQPWAAVQVVDMQTKDGGLRRLQDDPLGSAWQNERIVAVIASYVVLAESWQTAYSVEDRLRDSFSSGRLLELFQMALAQVGLGQWVSKVEILAATATFVGSWAYVDNFCPASAWPHALAVMGAAVAALC